MLFSFNKLKELANLKQDVKVTEVVKAINSIGFEVESYNKFTDIEGIKFGRIKEVNSNPNGTKLNVCKVQFDDTERTIQTTATNVEEGQIIIAFIPGSRVGTMIVESKELKGIISEGMLSSPNEFGIANDLVRDELINNITTYSEDIDLMEDPIKYLDLDDYIIDVSILSNRSDANSYYIMAMELAGYFDTKVSIPEIKVGNIETNITAFSERAKSLVLIETKNNVNISIKEQIFLAKNGVKSISDVVDITNLTLLYAGQPTHAYDKAKVGDDFHANLYSGQVNIFGNKEINLDDDLVILSNNQPVSVAGVIGLENCKVTNQSQELVIELGRFNIKEVRKSVKAAKLNTNSSNQSSKEIAKGTTELAIRYLSNKLINFSQPINYEAPTKKTVAYDVKKVSMLAGLDITNESKYHDAIHALEKQGFEFNENEVLVPSHRHDIESQQDLNEEIFRFYGYDNFKPVAPKVINYKVEKINNVKSKIVAQGYSEVATYTLTSQVKNVLNPFDQEEVKLETFVSKEREVIRNSQIIPLLETIEYHQKRKINDLSIFDIGIIANDLKTIALASTTKSFNEMKRDVLAHLPSRTQFQRFSFDNAHPYVTAKIILDGDLIGWIGKVHPSISKTNAFVAEWIDKEYKSFKKYEDYDASPLKTRDITFKLSLKEDIAYRLKDFKDVYDLKVIDEFKKENQNHVTVRITADEETIKMFEGMQYL